MLQLKCSFCYSFHLKIFIERLHLKVYLESQFLYCLLPLQIIKTSKNNIINDHAFLANKLIQMVLLSWHRFNCNCLVFCKDLVIFLFFFASWSCIYFPDFLCSWEKPFITVFICFNYFSSRFIDGLWAYVSNQRRNNLKISYGAINWTKIIKKSLIKGKVFNNCT